MSDYYDRKSKQDSQRIAQWCLIGCVVVLAIVVLSGCATDWHKTRPAAETVRVVDTPLQVIQSIPGCKTAAHCAVVFMRENVCVVLAQVALYSKSDAEHEMKHCEGWDHK